MSAPGNDERGTTRGLPESGTPDAAVTGVSTDIVLTEADERMWSMLVAVAGERREVRSTYRQLAAAGGVARSTSHRVLDRLQTAGLITVELGSTGLVIRLVES